MKIQQWLVSTLFLFVCTSLFSQEVEVPKTNKFLQGVQKRLYLDVGGTPFSIVLESNNNLNIIGFNADVGYKFTKNFSVFMSSAPSMMLDKENSTYIHLFNSGIGITYSFFANDVKQRKFKGLFAEIKGGIGDYYYSSSLFSSKEFSYYEVTLKCKFEGDIYIGLGFNQRFFENEKNMNSIYPVIGFKF